MNLDRTTIPQINNIQDISIPTEKKFTLDNGIPLYILNGGVQEVIKLDVIIPAGSLYGNDKLTAPLTGLMLHEGTTNKSAHEIAEAFDYYGAYFQPVVEKDNSIAGLISINKYFKETLPLFAEAILESTFPEKEFSILTKRRKQNFLIESEKTSFLAKESFFKNLFGEKHPYGIKTKEQHYNEIQIESLINFYRNNYQSGQYKIIVSGKVSENEINLINKYFGNIAPTKISNPVILAHNKTVNPEPIIIEKKDAVQSSIRMGQITINKYHEDYIGLKILTTVLGGYFGSRLMKNIREEKGLTYGIHGMQVSLENVGYMAIAADVIAEKTKEAIAEIKNEIIKLQNYEVSAEELNLVKNFMMGDMLQMFDGPFSISEAFKGAVQFNLNFNYYVKMKETILNITPSELKMLANKYYNLDKIVTVVAGKY